MAIEFAMVFPPFLMLLFGIMGISLFFLTEMVLDHALSKSVRQIRTGQGLLLAGGGLKVGALRTQICNASAGLVDCSKLRMHIQSPATWSNFTPTSCATQGDLTPTSMLDTDAVSKAAGRSNTNVFVTVCYPWDLWVKLPYMGMGNLSNGSALLVQASVAFKIEEVE